MLHVEHHGPAPVPGGPRPLLIAHGLFGSARNWGAMAKRLGETRPVIAVDMRNHGASPWDDTHTYAALAADLAATIAAQGGRADVLGHSMGGKAAMALALTEPDRVGRLVVADIAPTAYSHSQLPLVDAMRGLDLTGVSRRGEAAERLGAAVPDRAVRAFLLQSLDLSGPEPRWRLNLDALADQMPSIMGWPEDLAGAFAGPVLFLAGALSDYVRPEHRATMRALFPAARFAKIPGAGHWLHADRPDQTAAAVAAFLEHAASE